MIYKKWVIIGGGVHGVTTAVHLLKLNRLAIEDILVIDPAPDYLFHWETKASRTGMKYLRSSSVHHLDVDPFSLQKYAKLNGWTDGFSGQYKRPALALFHDHCSNLIKELNLKKAYYRGSVSSLSHNKDNYLIQTDAGDEIEAEQVVVATGMMHNTLDPEWIEELKKRAPDRHHHLLSECAINESEIKPPILIVGGGISACQAALKWSERYPGKVILNMRHSFRISEFDSDPGWLGPKYMTRFFEMNDFEQRRRMINEARFRGSLPGYLFRKLKNAVHCEQLSVIEDEVYDCSYKNSSVQLHFREHDSLNVNQVICCTGYQRTTIVPDWLLDYAKSQSLPFGSCETPLVNNQLMWRKGLYLTGPMAELQIGPTARNIAGGRKAAQIIAEAAEVFSH